MGPRSEAHDAAEVLGGEWRETRGQRFLVVDRKYAPRHRHGDVAIADTLPSDDDVWPRLALLATSPSDASGNTDNSRNSARRGRMLFVDLETTGLAGGAGTYAFLVGCAWYQEGALRVRQFFLSNFGAERALLEAVAEMVEACSTVVTFNGKSFDVPLFETRCVLHRLETPFAGMPHVDMLHPARRLWKFDDVGECADGGKERPLAELRNCALTALEQRLFDYVRSGDVPGHEIASRYFSFVRQGDIHALVPILEHNRQDLVSLVMLTHRAARLLARGVSAAQSKREALTLGHYFERWGEWRDAEDCYAMAAGIHEPHPHSEWEDAWCVRAAALQGYAQVMRRQSRHVDAAKASQLLLSSCNASATQMYHAARALAVHHEHRTHDFEAAQTAANQMLRLSTTTACRSLAEHRLARIKRKGRRREGDCHDLLACLRSTGVRTDERR